VSPAWACNFFITQMTRVASSRYLRNGLSTEALSSSNALKYFRGVAFFFVFFHCSSIGLKSGENAGKRWTVKCWACI
jgi:hypothetical protein